MKSTLAAVFTLILTVFIAQIVFLSGCTNQSMDKQNKAEIYPMYVDNNVNGINDYFEEFTHESSQAKSLPTVAQYGRHIANGSAPYHHLYTDLNGDGICDYAQNGSNTWHGPGFIDNDNDGICDYWELKSPIHNRQMGMQYKDENQNQINDYFEQPWHAGYNHDFVDANGDGICDYAQDGSNAWHGPGFIDDNNDGICDHWQNGGKGYGPRHGGGMMGG